jgi:hypothetical protein
MTTINQIQRHVEALIRMSQPRPSLVDRIIGRSLPILVSKPDWKPLRDVEIRALAIHMIAAETGPTCGR